MIGWVNQALRRIPNWAVYLLGMLPAFALFAMAATGRLGVEPIASLEEEYGKLALQLLIASLMISPLRRYAGLNLMKLRRAIALLAFFYVTCHLLVWLLLDVQSLTAIWADIVKRPYITVGMAGFVLMVPLALTSNDWSVRKLGPRWRVLHRVAYPAAVAGAAHYVMQAKGFQIEPLIYFGVVLVLLILRLPLLRRRLLA